MAAENNRVIIFVYPNEAELSLNAVFPMLFVSSVSREENCYLVGGLKCNVKFNSSIIINGLIDLIIKVGFM